MTLRAVSLALIAWVLGFAAFMLALPRPLGANTTDAIVVPTGAPGRIDRGLALVGERQAKRLLVTGVAPGVRPSDLAREYRAAPALVSCCVDLGTQAVDTRSNAQETADWLRRHRYRSVRLVSSDWHARRAAMELRAALAAQAPGGGPGAVVLVDGVSGNARLGMLVAEYNKLLLARAALAWPDAWTARVRRWLGRGR